MNGNEKYKLSIAAELAAQRDRVHYFIGDTHWGEDGRYKEVLLADYLKSILPQNVSVGTGFVKNENNNLTSQIDIIIYRNEYPCLFQKGDFVILTPESVLGIIEVKSTADFNVLSKKPKGNPSVIEKCERNGKVIGSKKIFNGIWGYDSDLNFGKNFKFTKIYQQLKETNGYLNHISFNSKYFCRYWSNGNPIDRWDDPRPCFSFYNLSCDNVFGDKDMGNVGLAFGYFISNLLESVYRIIAPQVLSNQYYEFLYPLENTKEMYRISGMDVKQDFDRCNLPIRNNLG